MAPTNNLLPDIEIDETFRTNGRLLHERELKGSQEPSFDFALEVTAADGKKKIDTARVENRTIFMQNLRYWNDETRFMPTNNFDSSYYRNIVDMGLDAVPYILEVIQRRPSFIVRALDEILPGIVVYDDGYVPVEKACDIWISILKKIGEN